MKKIVLVEDEPFMREELEEIFQKDGYEVVSVTDFVHTEQKILGEHPQLVVLDLNLPNASGFPICRMLKQKSSFPVLILTSRDQMRDELWALELGADEYLTKPCRKERLLARVSNLLKRYEGRENLLEGPGFLLDMQTYVLYRDGTSMLLPQNQGRLLKVFLKRRGATVRKEELCMELWGTIEFIDENALQVNLTRLKKTLRQLGISQKIEPVRGIGYRMLEDEERYER